MKIFIKTFNRPYYLDRCLSSIEKFALGGPYDIVVIDDGTEEKYLHKIRRKYPYVRIISSEYAADKVIKIKNHIQKGIPVSGLKLPSEFWKSTIEKEASDYFLLLEDDIWFKTSFSLAEAEALMRQENMPLLKLFHFENERLTSGKKKKLADNINALVPKLFTRNPFLFEHFLVQNPLKIVSVLYKLGLLDSRLVINYYSIYNVAGCIFKKDYYTFLWQTIQEKVDENKQLIKAVKYLQMYQPTYGYTPAEVLRTSFTSSATNMFADIDFDVFVYNYLLNESWYAGDLVVDTDFEKDISAEQIQPVIESNISIKEWHRWQQRFKNQYTAVGHKID